MTDNSSGVERRAAQRFSFHLPVRVRKADTHEQGWGLTQDLSAGGALFFTDMTLSPGTAVELDLVMPAEVSLGEEMKVRCHARVLRVLPPTVGTKSGIAVHIGTYEFLPDAAASVARVAPLHTHPDTEEEETGLTASVFHPRPAVLP
jgi:PilZ domain